ncbi:MAG: CRTAC1 family protein, partial [Acidimicrobiia bacterium]|nr:CRTAC1 family protein [Acidimicrobiia bacterium]
KVSFADVAADVGLEFRHGAFQWQTGGDPAAMMGGGVCWLDYDGNGWLDLFAVNTWSNGEFNRWADQGGSPTSRLFANDRGQFRDVTDAAGAGLGVRGNGCVAADLDGDGWTDLFVTTDRENQLLWNDEGKGFTEGGAAAGVSTYGWHAGAAVGDVDGDGRLDLFVTGYANMNRRIPEATRGFPNTFQPEADLLLLNQGAVEGERPRFRDVAAEVGVEAAGLDYGLGAILSDVDGDGDLDVFVANDTNPNRLYLSEPADSALGFSLQELGATAGVDDPNAGMGIASGDYDGNGLIDLAVTNMGDQLHNVFRHGAGLRYRDDAPGVGPEGLGAGITGWGAAFVDVDLDADLDLVIAHGAIPVRDLIDDREPVGVFENRTADGQPGVFRDASSAVGLDTVGPYLGRGLAAADYDNDGDLDFAIGTIGGDLALLRSSGGDGHWLTVAPRPSIPGTVVTVTGSDGAMTRREVLAGSSYLSSEDDRVHVGLGRQSAVEHLQVEWPDGTVVELDDVAIDQILVVDRR